MTVRPIGQARLWAAALLSIAVLGSLSLPAVPATAETARDGDEIRVLARLPVASPADRSPRTSHWDTPTAQLLVNPASRRGYRLYDVGEADASALEIRSFDLDTLEPEGRSRVSTDGNNWRIQVPRGLQSSMPYAIDRVGGLLFVSIAFDRSVTKQIWVIDEKLVGTSLSPVIARLPIVAGADSVPTALRGLRTVREGNNVKLLLSYQRGPAVGVKQWDVARALSGADVFEDWDYPAISGCQLWNPLRSQVPLWRSGDHISTACLISGASRTAAVRLTLGPTGVPLPGSEQVYPGPPGVAPAALGDQSADRVHILGTRAGSQELWTFDFTSSRWVGRSGITLGDFIDGDSFGIDESTGRIYVLAPHQSVASGVPAQIKDVFPGGLMSIEGRLTPIPQPRLYPDLAYPSVLPIQIDDGHKSGEPHVFLRRAYFQERNPQHGEPLNCPEYPAYPSKSRVRWCAENHWLVIADALPLASDPSPTDQDRLTIDVPPKGGVTGSSFEASAGAWAARIRLVSGAQGAPLTCAPFSRVATTAWIEEAKLAANEHLARAVPVSVDDVTKGDLASPASRCQPAASPPAWLAEAYKAVDTLGQQWDVQQTQCTDQGSQRRRYERIPAAVDLSSGASCSSTLVESDSSSSIAIPGVLRIADAFSRTTVRREPNAVRVEAETRISGLLVDLGGTALRIDKVRTVATATSNGRKAAPDLQRASFERSVCGVHGLGLDTKRCYRDVQGAACATHLSDEHASFCRDEVSTLAAMITDRLGGRGAVRAPSPDTAYLEGSPGGYVAAVQKRPGDQYDDQLLNGDFSREVPALEIVREDDPRRQVVQLAGARALTTYGIYCLPPLVHDKARNRCAEGTFPGGVGAGQDGTGGLAVGDAAPGGTPGSGPSATGAFGSAPAGSAAPRTWRVLMVRSLGEGLLAAAAWFSLGAPTALAIRRRRAMRAVFEEQAP